MEPDVLKMAGNILSEMLNDMDPYEKISVILKMVPIESFDEVFRFFSEEDQKSLLEALELETHVSSIETTMLLNEFIKRNELEALLNVSSLKPDEIKVAFQKYAGKNPRKVSMMLRETWLI